MYTTNYIRDILKQYISNGIKKFIIYPLGINGINVKNVLKDYYDLDPCAVVDNEWSKYNARIIDKKKLKRIFSTEMYIILTIEHIDLNAVMLKELLEFAPLENIINLMPKTKETVVSNKGFLLADFLPKFPAKTDKNNDKIKVRIVHSTPSIWNSIDTICSEFKNDLLYDLLIIGKEGVQDVKKYGYKYAIWDDYTFEYDKPDIVILTNIFEKVPDPEKCRKHAKLVVVVPGFTIQYEETLEQHWENMQKGFGMCNPDYYLFDPYLYNKYRESIFFNEKMVEMGNAKFDGLYQAMQEKTYLEGWEKLRDKRTVLWAESHGVSPSHDMMKQISFDIYAKTIFEYANYNQELGIIFRPHPAFIQEMINYGFWSMKELQRIKQYCDDSPNIVFDDTSTYNNAFSVSNGVITSAFCGIIYSALPTLKPICACYRSGEDTPYEPDLVKNCYSVYRNEDIVEFLDMIRDNKDSMFLQRQAASDKYIKNFDGKNGWRIKEFIKEKYFEKN